MKLSLFNYTLPDELIAQKPMTPRDRSRLLVYDKKSKTIQEDLFYNLTKYLNKNDVLVFNNTKVMPARLIGKKITGGRAELLLLEPALKQTIKAIVGTSNPKAGLKIVFQHKLEAVIQKKLDDRTWLIKFNQHGHQLKNTIQTIGLMPLPPYIHSSSNENALQKQYQTIYAKHYGSSAAPTAGLHFTQRLLNKIKRQICAIEFITLHVGLGTFEPIKTDNIEDFQIHQESASIDPATLKRLVAAKKQGKRIIAVGTTSIRTLETAFHDWPEVKELQGGYSASINTYIYPGYRFKFVDAIITNFHLPKSSLILLISAFIGRKTTLNLYNWAIKRKFRFFSFGDAMFIK